jgi:hypothetical protein
LFISEPNIVNDTSLADVEYDQFPIEHQNALYQICVGKVSRPWWHSNRVMILTPKRRGGLHCGLIDRATLRLLPGREVLWIHVIQSDPRGKTLFYIDSMTIESGID